MRPGIARVAVASARSTRISPAPYYRAPPSSPLRRRRPELATTTVLRHRARDARTLSRWSPTCIAANQAHARPGRLLGARSSPPRPFSCSLAPLHALAFAFARLTTLFASSSLLSSMLSHCLQLSRPLEHVLTARVLRQACLLPIALGRRHDTNRLDTTQQTNRPQEYHTIPTRFQHSTIRLHHDCERSLTTTGETNGSSLPACASFAFARAFHCCHRTRSAHRCELQ